MNADFLFEWKLFIGDGRFTRAFRPLGVAVIVYVRVQQIPARQRFDSLALPLT